VANYKNVFTVIEREGAKSIWLKIGVAFETNSGSLNVILNALPVNGTLVIRDRQEREAGLEVEG